MFGLTDGLLEGDGGFGVECDGDCEDVFVDWVFDVGVLVGFEFGVGGEEPFGVDLFSDDGGVCDGVCWRVCFEAPCECASSECCCGCEKRSAIHREVCWLFCQRTVY